MKNIIKKILFVCLVGSMTFFSNCDDLLDVDIYDSITNNNYWETEGDVIGYATGLYNNFRSLINSSYHFEDRSDAFEPGLEGSTTTAWSQVLTEANAPLWRDYYNMIHHCNLIIKYAPDITPNSVNINRALAEAYFFRAYTYFMLIRSWGDVPIVLEPTESDDSPLPARSSASIVMTDVILKDIDQSLRLFPEKGFRNKNRASKPAVFCALADILLWKSKVIDRNNNELSRALAATDSVLASGVSLVDFVKIHDTSNKKNDEIIFSLFYLRDEKSDHYGSRLKPRDIFVASAANVNEVPYSKGGSRSVYAPSRKFMNCFINSADIRKAASYIIAINTKGETIGIFDNKFRGTLYEDDRYWENDHVVYRLGEILLFRAEIYAALGGDSNLAKAIAELNIVRKRANTGDYSGPVNKESVEREIFDERFRELWFEFKRWPDIVRFHYGGTINAYIEVPNLSGKKTPLFFPINMDDMALNPNLKQTDGYE